VTNLCVPTASGVPLRLLPKQINGVRIVGIDVPGFGVPTHAEAKDVLAGAMLNYARKEAEQGPVQAPRGGRSDEPTVTLVGEMFPADPVGSACHAGADGAGRRAGRADARMARALCRARLRRRRRDPPVLHRLVPRVRSRRPPVIGSAPVGRDGTAAWLRPSAKPATVSPRPDRAAQERLLPPSAARCGAPIKGRITLSGYEGSELLVARLLVESGADLRYVGTACPRPLVSTPTASGWRPAACTSVPRLAGAGPRGHGDARARLAIGTTPVVQNAKELAIPALYFTNLISARPLMGPAGAGSLAQVVNAAIATRRASTA
jgi:chlorophyllide a reductase subunit Y